MMRFSLYWGTTSLTTAMFVGDYGTYEEAWKAMVEHQRINAPQFGYYYRTWKDEDGHTNIDYGSHVHYYFILPQTAV